MADGKIRVEISVRPSRETGRSTGEAGAQPPPLAAAVAVSISPHPDFHGLSERLSRGHFEAKVIENRSVDRMRRIRVR